MGDVTERLKNDLTALVPRFEDSGHKALGGSQGPPGCAPPGCGDSRVTELAVRGGGGSAPSPKLGEQGKGEVWASLRPGPL